MAGSALAQLLAPNQFTTTTWPASGWKQCTSAPVTGSLVFGYGRTS